MKIKKKTLALTLRVIIKLSVGVLIFSFFYCYVYTDYFTIHSYQISGIDENDKLAILAQLRLLDTKKVYLVFPSNKIFTYSNSMIISTVRTVVEETSAITIRPVGLHTVKIDITLLKPLFRISDTVGLTNDGVIFTTKYNLSSYPRITIASSTTQNFKHEGLSFTQIVIPSKPHEKEFLTNLDSFIGKISSVIFPVDTILVESSGDVSAYNKEETSKILFLGDADLKKVWSTLLSAIDTDPLKSKLTTNKAGLEYLDVRYGNKVFYRFNDMAFQKGALTGILENHATSTQGISTTTQSTH